MVSRFLENYVVKIEESIFVAHWRLHKTKAILLVVNEKV